MEKKSLWDVMIWVFGVMIIVGGNSFTISTINDTTDTFIDTIREQSNPTSVFSNETFEFIFHTSL